MILEMQQISFTLLDLGIPFMIQLFKLNNLKNFQLIMKTGWFKNTQKSSNIIILIYEQQTISAMKKFC